MQKTEYTQKITDRFRKWVNSAGYSLLDEHYADWSLLIEVSFNTDIVK